jgi:hypothetical protein
MDQQGGRVAKYLIKFGGIDMVSDNAEHLTVHPKNRGIVGIAKAGRAHRYLCEDTVRIGW